MQKLKGIDLVIASGSKKLQECLSEMFSELGANVVLSGFLDQKFVEQLEYHISADVILIDMDDSYEDDEDALDQLVEKIDLPLLFHDNDYHDLNVPKDGECFSASAVEKLANKLAELAELVDSRAFEKKLTIDLNLDGQNNTEETDSSVKASEDEKFVAAGIESLADINALLKEELPGDVKPLTNVDSSEALLEKLALAEKESLKAQEVDVSLGASDDVELVEDTLLLEDTLILEDADLVTEGFNVAEGSNLAESSNSSDDSQGALNIWVLGASLGGTEAVKRFLARLPGELPVAFVLAQHLSGGFVSLLATQLDRISAFDVKEAVDGDSLSHGEVVVVTIDNRMSINSEGLIKFVDDDWKGHYKPSIDCVIDDVTDSFKEQSGVIIFSGMGADGVLASQQFSEKYNGLVWAQSSDTCVISSMPDSVRKANLVSYSGSPEALAHKIAVKFMGNKSHIV